MMVFYGREMDKLKMAYDDEIIIKFWLLTAAGC